MLEDIMKILNHILLLPRTPILFLIRIYQKTFSPDHGFLKFIWPHGYCRFYPSCSEYGYQVIKKRFLVSQKLFGEFCAATLGVKEGRICRNKQCHHEP
jgi:putative component of membrane protein insertase Oxa1/YidC/SpoIIIJ protein YidD